MKKKLRGRLVVSAENNGYTGWQAQVLARSAITRLGVAPLVVCHGGRDRELHLYFEELRRFSDVDVLLAPNYRRHLGVDYAPANTPGTLLAAARALRGHADFLVLLDPDMVFAGPVDFPGRLAGQHYRYLRLGTQRVQRIARRFGVDPDELLEHQGELAVGVPYVVPIDLAEDLAKAWFDAMRCFVATWKRGSKGSSSRWCDIMLAFGLACVKLGRIPEEVLDVNDSNFEDGRRRERPIVHYCYEADGWTKRDFFLEERAGDVWHPREAAAGTITGEVLAQIAETAAFFGHATAG